jgi:hypothetical protein
MTLIQWEKTLIPYRKIHALLDTSKEVGLEVNPEKNKYVLMSSYHNVGQKNTIE